MGQEFRKSVCGDEEVGLLKVGITIEQLGFKRALLLGDSEIPDSEVSSLRLFNFLKRRVL